jgi:hypothetical protein
MRSGSVKHFHNIAGGASKMRVVTKSLLFASAADMAYSFRPYVALNLTCDPDLRT